MPPEFNYTDEATIKFHGEFINTYRHVPVTGPEENHIVFPSSTTEAALKEARTLLRHGKKGLVSAHQLPEETYNFDGIRCVNFNPEATILVERGSLI